MPNAAENTPIVPMNSSTGMPFMTRTFLKTSSAIVEYNPIMPGQTSPFTVMDTGNPVISTEQTSFKEMMGGELLTDHSSNVHNGERRRSRR